ncbi:MAG: lipoyl(octanoyl) transferase LipB [Saprospiraceae bacterium]|nr:lipoyl(octanoyl) transferase LipB [Saprospiraceae bacterium]MBK7525790.1 lipoyl(octanoyl) transferase LipB [Saprospiraceae bacterium]MBK9043292.1 lipoyl(octanoyl) transferase LipB [Saprospiraceae bacterium]
MHKVKYEWIEGKSYEEVWAIQTSLHNELKERKKTKTLHESNIELSDHHLIFCQHSHVYTLGKSGDISHLLLDTEGLTEKGVEYFKINRGGDITYHGPGQITGYPILDLECFYTDVHRYVREIEEVIIQTLDFYQIKGIRIPAYTGVWVEDIHEEGQFRKICAIGVHLSRWVTLHGFAFNVNTDLKYFDHIIPCGIEETNLSVTSLQRELGRQVDIFDVSEQLKTQFEKIFKFKII